MFVSFLSFGMVSNRGNVKFQKRSEGIEVKPSVFSPQLEGYAHQRHPHNGNTPNQKKLTS